MTEADDRNAELIERGFGAFSRGAFDEAIASMHPEIEWQVMFRLPDLPLSNGKIITRARFRGRGTASGAEVDRVVYYAYRVEDELLRWIRPFDTEAEARAALGVRNVP